MKILFYILRHGTTTDSHKGIIRGDRNALLDKKGFQDAHEAKNFMAPKPWKGVYASDLARATQTARIVGEGKEEEVHTGDRDLRPWNVGYLTGKDKKQYSPDMTVFIEHPNMAPQDGESRNDFFRKLQPCFLDLIDLGIRGAPPILIGHSSVIHALAHMLWGDEHPPLAVKPGGIIEVFVNKKGEVDAREIFKPGKDDSSFAGGKQPTS